MEKASNALAAEVAGIVQKISENERGSYSGGLLQPFSEQGWTFVGRGQQGHGYVLRSPDGSHIARVGNDLVASMTTALLAEKNAGNPWFPEVPYQAPLPCSDAVRYVAVYPFFNLDKGTDTKQISSLLGDYSPDSIKCAPEFREKLLADTNFVEAARQVMMVSDALSKRFRDIYPGFDAFGDNIMLRNDGHPVFTDPFKQTGDLNRYPLYSDHPINKAREALQLPALEQPDEGAREWAWKLKDPAAIRAIIEPIIEYAYNNRSVPQPGEPAPRTPAAPLRQKKL